MNQGLTKRQQTWSYLKKELLKRCGPKKNKAAAEWRVNNRSKLYGESYNDFAAGLRNAADRYRVSERVFLAQQYRYLDMTPRQLVKLDPRPSTLEEAVAKTTDPADNAMQGVRALAQAFPLSPRRSWPRNSLHKPTRSVNDYAVIYKTLPGRKWNGRFWEKVSTNRKVRRSPSTPSAEARKSRAKRTRDDSGDEE
ncbi:hypothetical protein PHMEG_00032860 [Phytophthora megakarya]|uniref:Uncharacterized protein n=1 Tax=Phytophthora megakarya TaxID=4795 RepID=A0A225UV62_9STRA|nr:hypothetical protein PHMEG_00032860 [Phytophthora megakarya]